MKTTKKTKPKGTPQEKDWTREKRKGKFPNAIIKSALEQSFGSKVVAARLLKCSRSTLDRYICSSPELEEVYGDLINGHLDEIESTVFSAAKDGNMNAATFVLRTLGRKRGYVEFKPQYAASVPQGSAKEILIKLRDGEISVSDAALEFEILGCPLPETLRTLLAREDRQLPDPSAGRYSSISDEEFELRAAERKAQISQQREGLEDRRAEIKILRDEASDSFAPDQKVKNHD